MDYGLTQENIYVFLSDIITIQRKKAVVCVKQGTVMTFLIQLQSKYDLLEAGLPPTVIEAMQCVRGHKVRGDR